MSRMFRTGLDPQRLTQAAFLRIGLYRPELTWGEAGSYLGGTSTGRFNRLLNRLLLENETFALVDKIETASRQAAAGIPVAEVHAVFPGNLVLGRAETLRLAEEMAACPSRPGSTHISESRSLAACAAAWW
jgi:hypothetical protein